ncbi:MAG: nucleotide exchange factor GrpE [Desulfococcaceae bacterium]|jgi:molecular chaperone GrpE|nr:nucleotide exchange factor GrpE [Desulfococcaceae bacterium]
MTEELKTDEESVKVKVTEAGDKDTSPDSAEGISGNASGDEGAEKGNKTEDTEEAIRQELNAEKERFLRMYAEFDNYKKRCTRDMQDFRKYANESLLRELLPIIDNLERAVQSAESGNSTESSVKEGVELILKDMLRLMEKFHVKAVTAVGQPFDPMFHEAIGQEESREHGDNIVLREFQKGYLLHDRLIRPSMVMVSKAGAKTDSSNTEETKEEEKESPAEEDKKEKEDSTAENESVRE